jgi:hypothetical protein
VAIDEWSDSTTGEDPAATDPPQLTIELSSIEALWRGLVEGRALYVTDPDQRTSAIRSLQAVVGFIQSAPQ